MINARIGINFFRVERADKYIPLYSPRTSYKNIRQSDEKLLADLTFNFDRFTINTLKKQFERSGWSMKLPEFISAVKEHLTVWQADLPNRDIKLVRCLSILFRDIDINENGDLEWEEFTNYIIEKATVLKNLKSKSDEVKAYTKSSILPKQKFEGIIPKAVYIPDINRLALFEESSNIIRFMNPDTGEFNPKNLAIDPKKLIVNMESIVKDKKTDTKIHVRKDIVVSTDIRLLDMIYLGDTKYKMLITSTSDGIVKGWKFQSNSAFQLAQQPDNQEQFVEHQFSQEVYCMAWDSLNEVLYCGLKNGSISMWNLKTDTQRPMLSPEAIEDRKQAHQSLIMDMITMPKLQFMASGGMDGKLILWDTINHKIKWVYKQHTRGILSLSFNQSLILMFSAGFDHQICIWNPYIPTLIHKIQGHLSPILSVKVIQGTNQIISLDSQGIVKVSDIRRFNNISSFSIESSDQGQTFSPTSMTIILKPLKLCFTGRTVNIFEYDKNYNPSNVDDFPAVCCKYIEESLVFVTPSGSKVKVWNALSGDVDKIYLEVTMGEISAFCLDGLKRRMIIGDAKGNISIYNASNGARMKALPKHNGEVTHLLAGKLYNTDVFVSVGMDNQIHILKETEDGIEHVKSIHVRKQCAVSCITLNSTAQILIVSTSHGSINFYETQTSKFLGGCSQSVAQQITSLCIMEQPLLISSTISGRVSLVMMPPATQRFDKLNLFSHSDQENPGLALGILTAVYSNQLKRYFLVDQKCYLCCYTLKDIQIQWNPQPNFSSSSSRGFMSKRRTIQKINGRFISNISLLWSVKTHTQLVRTVDYIDSQRLLVTCGYDRRVMIWDAISGQHIDSLQQNYDKRMPKYVALQKYSTGEIFDSSMKEVMAMRVQQSDQFNPFYYFQGEEKRYGSNPEWRLVVDFKKHFEGEEQRLKEILETVEKYKQDLEKKEEKTPKLDALIEKSPFLRQIVGRDLSVEGNLSTERAEVLQKTLMGGTRTFREHSGFKEESLKKTCPTQRSLFNQNILIKQRFGTDLDELTNRLGFRLNKKQQQIFGNFKVNFAITKLSRIKTKQQVYHERKEHDRYINALSRRNLRSKQVAKNDDQILLSKQQVRAAHKLSKAFANLDKDDSKTTNLFRNVIVRQKQNTARYRSTRLPRM